MRLTEAIRSFEQKHAQRQSSSFIVENAATARRQLEKTTLTQSDRDTASSHLKNEDKSGSTDAVAVQVGLWERINSGRYPKLSMPTSAAFMVLTRKNGGGEGKSEIWKKIGCGEYDQASLTQEWEERQFFLA